jgi:hypothetical protein
MRKVSSRRSRHNQKPGVNHYEALRRQDAEHHPIDVAIEAQLHHVAIRRRIRGLQARLLKLLGPERQVYFDLEALTADQQHVREVAFFNLGYEYGATDVRRRVIREMSSVGWPKRLEHVAARLRDEILQSGLSEDETLIVLVESLWAFTMRSVAAQAPS